MSRKKKLRARSKRIIAVRLAAGATVVAVATGSAAPGVAHASDREAVPTAEQVDQTPAIRSASVERVDLVRELLHGRHGHLPHTPERPVRWTTLAPFFSAGTTGVPEAEARVGPWLPAH